MKKNLKKSADNSKAASGQAEPQKEIHWPLRIVVFSMVLVTLMRLRLLAIPLERDEGGFAYIGRHLFSDHLYTDLFDNKLPGLYTLYALFCGLFGYGPGGIHFGLLLCNLTAIWLMYRLISPIFNPWAAAVAASVFAFTSLSPNVYGFAAHATQLLLPFALGGILLLHKGLEKNHLRSIGLAGLLLGLAFIIKQQVVTYGIFAGIWLLLQRWHERSSIRQTGKEIGIFSLGAILPFGLVCLYFMAVGRFDDLWIWTVELPAQLGNSSVIGDRWNIFTIYFSKVVQHFELIWVLAGLGWISLFFSKYDLKSHLFGLLFPVLSFASVAIGVAYYQHYFVLCLPAVALLTGIFVDQVRIRFSARNGIRWAIASVCVLFLVPVVQDTTGYYWNPDFVKIHRLCYGTNPFPELQQVGEELGRRTQPGDKIGILGSEPELLVYSNRNSATGHLFLYNLLSQGPRSADLQQQYLDDLKRNKPAYLVWVTGTGSWVSDYVHTTFFANTRPIVESGYALCGKAEAFEDGQPGVVVWDRAALQYKFKGNNQIYIYKRR